MRVFTCSVWMLVVFSGHLLTTLTTVTSAGTDFITRRFNSFVSFRNFALFIITYANETIVTCSSFMTKLMVFVCIKLHFTNAAQQCLLIYGTERFFRMLIWRIQIKLAFKNFCIILRECGRIVANKTFLLKLMFKVYFTYFCIFKRKFISKY